VLDNSKPLPVLKRGITSADAATKTAIEQVTAVVETWKNALANNDAEKYLQSYSPDFTAIGMDRKSWEEQRKMQILTGGKRSVAIDKLIVAPQGKRMTAIFNQTEQYADQQEAAKKMLYLEQQEG